MKKSLLSIFLLLGSMTPLIAQEVQPCATSEKMQELYQSLSPQQKTQYNQDKVNYEQDIQSYILAHPELKSDVHDKTITYTIPIVFHILHQGGTENISNEQVENAVMHMNQDYQKLNADRQNTVSEFTPLIADIQVEFKLAKLDPNGNCTNGITRTFTPETANGNANRVSIVKAAHGDWPGDKYLNIFVARNIGGAAGYTNYPNNGYGSQGGANMSNGIHVLYNYVGGIGASGTYGIHTLSHEAGHWFNLAHVWGDTNDPGLSSNCNTDDHVNDTPNTIGWTTCNVEGSTCDTGLDNVQNFMDYSYCSTMFTLGQKARMHAALNSSTGGRNNLWSASNLAATGVNLPDVLCTADFQTNIREVCSGTTINYEDLSYNSVSSWSWEFEGGQPATSTEQNPSITYNTPGLYSVTLTASDGSNTASETKTAFIKVVGEGVELPFEEGFEEGNPIGPNGFWTVNNIDDNQTFTVTNTASYSGSKSIKLSNFGQAKNSVDELISQPIDFSNLQPGETPEVTFKFSYRKRSSGNKEKLKIYISNNCGVSWSLRDAISSTTLGTEISSGAWTPTSESDWKEHVFTNITSDYLVDNLRIKFVFESDGGNNLYIDDINITTDKTHLGINEENTFQNLNVYPNPANNLATVAFSLQNTQRVDVELVNMMGQTIQTENLAGQKGKNKVELNTSNVEAGIYLVKVKTGNAQQVKRLIIQ